MGFPPKVRAYGGIGVGLSSEGPGTRFLSRAMFGIHRDLGNPIQGLLGIAVEGWAGTHAQDFDGGGRVMLALASLGLQAGLDYSIQLNRAQVALTLFHPLRRGGTLVSGDGIRFDFVPARGEITASLRVPLFQPHMGKTRPRAVAVKAREAPRYAPSGTVGSDSSLHQTLGRMREAARWIAHLIVPYFPAGSPEATLAEDSLLAQHLRRQESDLVDRHSVAAEIAIYYAELQHAFELVAGDGLSGQERVRFAQAATDTARRILLDEVLIPYDRDLGRIRRPPVLRALQSRAQLAFAGWLERTGGGLVPTDQHPAVLGVYETLLATVQEVADTMKKRWGDSRLIWLPLQYALRPEDHDTQSELDRLLERIAETEFLPAHDVVYTTDERFDDALINSILEAEDYHVLWIHDFVGRNPDGRPDSIAQKVTIEAYFRALGKAARAFDSTRKVPTFLIFHDQYYYKPNFGKRWLKLLQDPLGFRFRLPDHFRDVELAVRAAQDTLQAAVAASPALQAEANRRGQEWLRGLFAVHVSVTNPPDPSFRGPPIGRGLPYSIPDDVMRDHRKIAFADVTERDPSRGVAILTGLGVGEHYARFRWLDRTMVLRGPAALTLKQEARVLLLSQGFREEEIPRVLRPEPSLPDSRSRPSNPEANGWSPRAAIAMNATGYGPKHATAAKAALYTLMPRGSVMVATDPQWLSRFWGGMLLGSALRGCKVVIIGPGPDNAPFAGSFVQLSLQRELFLRLVQAREILREPILTSGGSLHVGLFRVGLGTYNVRAAVLAVRDGIGRYPFIREIMPFHRGVWELFEEAATLLGGDEPTDTTAYYHPKFHLKTQFFGTSEAMRDVVGHPEWRQFFAQRIRERLEEGFPAGTYISLEKLMPLRPYLEGRSTEARESQALYLIVGSHNQDPRSFMLDGEALSVIAGEAALLGAGDMLLLSTVGVAWLDGPADVERELPSVGSFRAGVARAFEGLF
jgi:hypothetical protein